MELEQINTKWTALKVFTVVAIFSILYVIRPLIHPIVYRIFYSPGMLYMLGIPLLIALIVYLLPPVHVWGYDSISSKSGIVITAFGVGLILALTLGTAGALVEERSIAQDAMEEVEVLDEFPEINDENPRIAPRAVSDVQASGSVSYRQYELGTSDIARAEDGSLVWSYPIQPDQFQNRLTGNQQGIFKSDMTAMEDRNLSVFDDEEFKYGQNQLLHRNVDWQLIAGDYWSQYRDDAVEFMHEGEVYMAVPKTGHEWSFTPVPHTTPTWDGVALIHQSGEIEHLSPEEAQESEILNGQRLYPIYNSERTAESLGYRNGIINQMPVIGSFAGVIEPASMPEGAGNEQPFTIDMEDEVINYVYAFEPAGEDTTGLDEVWFFDSETGEMQYYGTEGETLLGPDRATGIVRSEDTRTDWDTVDSDGQFEVVEPIPVIVDDMLWWHTKVVPVDNTDVTRNVMINSETEEAVELLNTDAVLEFLGGEEVDDIDDAGDVGETVDENGEVVDETDDEQITVDDGDMGLEIVISDEDGNEIERIPFESEYDISIEQIVENESVENGDE